MAEGNGMSVLTGLPTPIPAEGKLATAWREWKRKFEIYLKETRQADEKTPSGVKTSLLLHGIGSDGQEVCESFSLQTRMTRRNTRSC